MEENKCKFISSTVEVKKEFTRDLSTEFMKNVTYMSKK